MDAIERLLRENIDGTYKLALLGIGSVLKGDDAAGSRIAGHFIDKYSEESSPRLRVFDCSTAPESFTGAIRAFCPDNIMIIDAADAGSEPGSVFAIDPENISQASFSTHMLPLKFIIDYLKSETGCRAAVIGIQPGDLTFGAPMSAKVEEATSIIINALDSVLKNLGFLG